jgi:hypothetical protein
MVFPQHRPPFSLKRPGSSSPELHLPFRVRSCLSPARHPEASNASSRVLFPLRDQSTMESTNAGLPHPTTFHPQCFSHSRRVTPPPALWASFIPQPRPGFALQGLSPLPSRLISSTSHTLMPLPGFSYRRIASTGARSTRLVYRALVQTAIRCGQQGV